MDNRDIVLEAKGVSKIYGINKGEAGRMMAEGRTKEEVRQKTGATAALWDVSFQVRRGEIFSIIGLSGSGKSTIIRCFNQLLRPTGGHVYFEGRCVDEMGKKELLDLRRSKISMVFQNFGLFTHRTVLDNVAYGLEVRGMSRTARDEKSMEFIEMVGLKGWEDKPIASLSGGMKQRVGIARALTSDPEVLLMDEPFSALDPLVRSEMQFELLQIQRKLDKTILFITHDMNEAFKLGDTVAIMRDARIVQIDTPEAMTANPADDYVRHFIESADKTQVLTAHQVMITHVCLVREKDDPANALREMKKEGFSSAYVVDGKMRLVGVVTAEAAAAARQNGKPLAELVEREVTRVLPDTLVSDVIPLTAESRFPIAVADGDGTLLGIVTKAVLLSCIS
ncbi:MAG: ATP-binding cassette domain-containing protein [Clostridia bacterium]|nr:ATP-binding cassette domain-containing protein [Clostridia bacterium]